jgi:sporulation protein YlmC with PRC-barrel domain
MKLEPGPASIETLSQSERSDAAKVGAGLLQKQHTRAIAPGPQILRIGKTPTHERRGQVVVSESPGRNRGSPVTSFPGGIGSHPRSQKWPSVTPECTGHELGNKFGMNNVRKYKRQIERSLDMLKELLTTTAVVLALTSPTYAGSTATSANGETQISQTENPCNPCAASNDEQSDNPCAAVNPCAAAKGENPCNPCAAASTEAQEGDVIAVQSEEEARMDKLIGMSVSNSLEEDVGEVQDVLFNKDGSITGVVLSVGGFLGIGDKLVALPWDAVEVQYEEDVVLITATREQLEAAPPFKTLEEVQAEEEAQRAVEQQQQQMQQQQPVEPQ